MRVLHWCDSFLPAIGGVETLGGHLAAEQRRRGHDVTVVVLRWDAEAPAHEDLGGVAVYRQPFANALLKNDLGAMRRQADWLARLLAERRPEVIHLHHFGYTLLLYLLARPARRIPCLFTLHTPIAEDVLPRAMLVRALGSCDRIAAVSHALLEELRAFDPGAASRASVVWNGLREPSGRPRPLCLAPEVLLCLGRLGREKGFDVALRAFAQVARNRPAARLVIAGQGAERPALERLAGSLGLAENVDFAGAVDRSLVPALMNGAGVVLVPSRWQEPFGLVALEAAQMGRPVVASRVGGLAEVVEDGRTGLLVAPEDPVALAAAVERLLDRPGFARELGLRARERALREFSMERCADRYEEAYRRIASA
jgi:glycogen(starch) synthase